VLTFVVAGLGVWIMTAGAVARVVGGAITVRDAQVPSSL
jgi:hypothetical protein